MPNPAVIGALDIVQLLDLANRGLPPEAQELADGGIVSSADDVFWLSLSEVAKTPRTRQVDRRLLEERRADFAGGPTGPRGAALSR